MSAIAWINVIEYFQCLVIEHQDNTIAFDVWRIKKEAIDFEIYYPYL